MLHLTSFLELVLGASCALNFAHTAHARSVTDADSSRRVYARSTGLSIPFARRDTPESSFSFQNINGVSGGRNIYTANITVGGKTFEVQLDTGSSDLWLDTTGVDVSSLTNTGVNASTSYGDSSIAAGPILIGNLTFGPFTFPQAFTSAPGTNATSDGDKGLLGVGPPGLSAIATQLNGTDFNGKTTLENLFASNTSTPHFIAFQLSRSEETGATNGGIFTIGDTDSSLRSIISAPQLPVVSVKGSSSWTILMDNIIVNGQNFSGHSQQQAAGQKDGQTVALIDSGTALGSLPQPYLDAIYSNVPGAELLPDNNSYIVPCDTQINVSFVFAGIEYPLDPIDIHYAVADDKGNIGCVSTLSNINSVSGGQDAQDIILGDAFMRNVYSLFNFGSFIAGDTNAPFIQMLSTTNFSSGNAQFATLSQQRNTTLAKNATSSPTPSSSTSNGGVRTTNVPSLFLFLALAISTFST